MSAVAVVISAQAHMRATHVKAASAAGRSQNKYREALGITALATVKEEQ